MKKRYYCNQHFLKSFTCKTVAKTSWHRYGTKLRDCFPMYTQGDIDVISTLAGFRRHLVGKTLINVFHCNIAEIRIVGKLVIIQRFS